MHLVKSVYTLDTLFQSFRKHVYKVRAGDKALLVEPWPSMHRALGSARVLCISGAVEHSYNLSTRRRQENQRYKRILGYVAEFKDK